MLQNGNGIAFTAGTSLPVKARMLALLCSTLWACSNRPVSVTAADFVDSINASGGPIVLKGIKTNAAIYPGQGAKCSFENHDIIRITLDFHYKSLGTKEEVGSEKHRGEVGDILARNAHFHNGDTEVERAYHYWPEKTTETSAIDMKLFYVVPAGTDLGRLRFEYDTAQLGGATKIYKYTSFGSMKRPRKSYP